MTTERDPGTRIVLSWLREEGHENAERVLLLALDEIDTTPQRRSMWPAWRTPRMNKLALTAAAAATVLVVAVVGYNLLPGLGIVGPGATRSSPAADLPVGPHVMDVTNGPNEATVTVTIPATGWFAEPDGNAVTKDLGGDDRVTVVAAPADFYQVPADICNWRIDDAQPFPNSIDDFVAALAAQTYDTPTGSIARELSTPVAITIDGSPGQSITSVVPLDPNSDPDGCDEQRFCSVLDRDGYGCHLSHLEPGALDTVWVVTPGDSYYLVVAASYWPTTSSELLAELNAIVDSMTMLHE